MKSLQILCALALLLVLATFTSAQTDSINLFATPLGHTGTVSYFSGNFTCNVECANIQSLQFIWPAGNNVTSVNIELAYAHAGTSPNQWQVFNQNLDLTTNQLQLSPINPGIVQFTTTVYFYVTVTWASSYYSPPYTTFTTVDSVMQVMYQQGMLTNYIIFVIYIR